MTPVTSFRAVRDRRAGQCATRAFFSRCFRARLRRENRRYRNRDEARTVYCIAPRWCPGMKKIHLLLCLSAVNRTQMLGAGGHARKS